MSVICTVEKKNLTEDSDGEVTDKNEPKIINYPFYSKNINNLQNEKSKFNYIIQIKI